MSVAAAALMCSRCNRPAAGGEKCPTCGTRLQTLASLKRRGWVALVAGAFIVILMGCVWAYVATLFATRGPIDRTPATAQFIGRTYVAFALVMLSGILGIVNGILQVRSGRRSRVLTFLLLVLFAAAVLMAATIRE